MAYVPENWRDMIKSGKWPYHFGNFDPMPPPEVPKLTVEKAKLILRDTLKLFRIQETQDKLEAAYDEISALPEE